MKADWIKTRQTKYTAYISIYILVILAVLGVANFLANRYDKSYDATANKQFSLSDQTVKAVKGLKKDVNVSYFGETTQFPQARDLLGRYASLSPKLKVTYIDPVKKPQLARAAGVRQEGTIVVDSGERKEDAKSLTEEEITGALIRSVKGGERNACFLSGSGEHGLDDTAGSGFSTMKESLEHNNYKTRAVNVVQPAAAGTTPGGAPVIGQVQQAKVEIPKDCTVLVSGGPKLAYSAAEAAAIKGYIEGGGSVLFMLDTPLRIGQQEGTENPEVVKMLAEWGVTANADLALDTSGVGQIFGLGPEVAMVTTYESHAIVRDFKEGVPTAIPLSRTLKVDSNTKGTVEKLMSTTDNSFSTTNVSGPIDPKKGIKGPLVLAAAGTYNTGKPGSNGRFVVFGSSQWAVNNFLGSRQVANRDLALNTFNWLSADEDLISIRPKETEDRRLTNNAPRAAGWVAVALPVSVVIFGLMVWWRRR